MVTDHEGHQTI